MKELDIFNKITENPYAYAENWKNETGRNILGYFCTYTPEELIFASGSLPFRLFGSYESTTNAEMHLQSYCCSLIKGGLEDSLTGKLNFLKGTVFPHTCDSIQRLSDIWRLNSGFPVHIDVVLPVKLNTESSRKYMIDVFKIFKSDIEKSLNIKIEEKKLSETIILYNSIRRILGEIYRLKSSFPDIISSKDIYRVIKAGMIMDRKIYHEKLNELLSALKSEQDSPSKSDKKRIFLAGGLCNHPDIFPIMEDSGATVIWDELCTGTRSFEGEIDESKDPVEAIADRYFNRIVCPAKHKSTTERGDNLVKLVKEHSADGVVFMFLKFCDPQSFDYPYLKEFLDKEGVPNMLLEIDEQDQSHGQMKTRFETFIEML